MVPYLYRICHSSKGVAQHHKSTSSPHFSLHKQHQQWPTQLGGIESVLFLFQYPSVNHNLTMLLNSHPNIAMFERGDSLSCEGPYGGSSIEEEILTDVFSHKSLERTPLSSPTEQKEIKVLGVSSKLTLKQTQLASHHVELCLKKISTLHLPVHVLLVDTAMPTNDINTTTIDYSSLEELAEQLDIPLLSVKWHSVSPRSFLTKLCAFIGVHYSQDFLNSVSTSLS